MGMMDFMFLEKHKVGKGIVVEENSSSFHLNVQ
jgi:hypothetical protein